MKKRTHSSRYAKVIQPVLAARIQMGTAWLGSGENYMMRSLMICTFRPNIVRMIKSRRIRWEGHVACTGGEERRIQGFGKETWGKETTWKTQGVDGRIILRWIFMKWDVGVWTGSSWLRIGTGFGHLWMGWWTFGFHSTFGAGIIFFLILTHTVYKMWIKQEPNMLELWNKLHFEEKETDSIYRV